MSLTVKYRNKAKVPYPNAYASAEESAKSIEKYQFNCAQRAHANFTENHTNFLVTLLVAGIGMPEISAGLGAMWILGRFLYASGYVRPKQDGGKGRYNGIIWYIPHVGLIGMAGWSAWKVVMG